MMSLVERAEGMGSFEFPVEAVTVKESVEKYIKSVIENVESRDGRFKCTLMSAGSSYDNLKIGKPNEFDFMVTLDCLNADDSKYIRVREQTGTNGLVSVALKDPSEWMSFIKNGVLDTELLTKEYRKLLNIALKEVTIPDGLTTSHLSVDETNPWAPALKGRLGAGPTEKLTPYSENHGPALTLFMMWNGKHYQDLELTVDITLALQFDINLLPIPMGEYPEVINLLLEQIGFHVVPVEQDVWQITFQQIEKEFLNMMTGFEKEFIVIRGLKYIKSQIEKQFNFPEGLLPSYFLKTIFMHRLSKQIDTDPNHSKEIDNIAEESLSELLLALQTEDLHSYFLPNQNLLLNHLDRENGLRLLLLSYIMQSVKAGKIIASVEEANKLTEKVIVLQAIDLVEFYALSILHGQRPPSFWNRVFGNLIRLPLRNRWFSFWNQMTDLWSEEMGYEEYMILIRVWPFLMKGYEELIKHLQDDSVAITVAQEFFNKLERKKWKNKHYIAHASGSQIQAFTLGEVVIGHFSDVIDSTIEDGQLLTFLHRGIPKEWFPTPFFEEERATVRQEDGATKAILKFKKKLEGILAFLPPDQMIKLPVEFAAQIIRFAKETMMVAFAEPVIDGLSLD